MVAFHCRSIFSAVGEDTVVFVFGDHGMTVSGDHGGETEMETTAGLLVYTPSPLFPPEQVYILTVTSCCVISIETKCFSLAYVLCVCVCVCVCVYQYMCYWHILLPLEPVLCLVRYVSDVLC